MAYRTHIPENPILIAAFGNHIFGMDPVSGKRLWEQKVSNWVIFRIAVGYERVYVWADSNLYAFDYTSGTPLWKQELGRQFASPQTILLQEGRIFLASSGRVCCYSLEGEKQWEEGFRGKGLGNVALGFPGNVVQIDKDT